MRIAHLVVAVSTGVVALALLVGAASAVEEPPHNVVARNGNFEIRDYPALSVAELTMQGDRNSVAYGGFRKLAGFIFGANSRKQSLQMTAPVIEVPTEDGDDDNLAQRFRRIEPQLGDPVRDAPRALACRSAEARRPVHQAAGGAADPLRRPPLLGSRRRHRRRGGDRRARVDTESPSTRSCWSADHRPIRSALDVVVPASQRNNDSNQVMKQRHPSRCRSLSAASLLCMRRSATVSESSAR